MPDGAGRDELDEARDRAALAYGRGQLRYHRAAGGKPIILPAGPGAVLGVICLGPVGIEMPPKSNNIIATINISTVTMSSNQAVVKSNKPV